MSGAMIVEGQHLVAAVRTAARAHRTPWDALVPNQFEVNLSAEQAEEAAYSEMARAKARLRDHICEITEFRSGSSAASPRLRSRPSLLARELAALSPPGSKSVLPH